MSHSHYQGQPTYILKTQKGKEPSLLSGYKMINRKPQINNWIIINESDNIVAHYQFEKGKSRLTRSNYWMLSLSKDNI